MASQLASLEEDKKAYQEQLDIVRVQLKDDAENAELRALYAELNDMIGLINESISELRPKQAPKEPSPPPASAPAPKPQEKWSRENHPAFKQTPSTSAPQSAPTEEKEESQVSYQVNDDVLAKWLSGDKKFWPARITSITGSSTAPIYIVKFKNYKGTETLRARDIRPASNKRKADGPPATTATATATTTTTTAPASTLLPPPAAAAAAAAAVTSAPAPQSGPSAPLTGSNTGAVLSAAPSLYSEPLASKEAEKNPHDVQGKPPKAKKIKANKELEAGKNKWQEFSSKSKFGKTHKKESMFRTPEGIHGRVGFTGSGQAMRKDQTRSRHVYQMNEEAE